MNSWTPLHASEKLSTATLEASTSAAARERALEMMNGALWQQGGEDRHQANILQGEIGKGGGGDGGASQDEDVVVPATSLSNANQWGGPERRAGERSLASHSSRAVIQVSVVKRPPRGVRPIRHLSSWRPTGGGLGVGQFAALLHGNVFPRSNHIPWCVPIPCMVVVCTHAGGLDRIWFAYMCQQSSRHL